MREREQIEEKKSSENNFFKFFNTKKELLVDIARNIELDYFLA